MDLYAGGDIPGDRAQSLLEDAGAFAEECGRHELQDLRAHQSAGSSRNINRDLRKKLLKRSNWPPTYIEQVRFWSLKEKALVSKKLAFLLPHEIVGALMESGQQTKLLQSEGLDLANRARHNAILGKLGAEFVSLSLWGDGVPVSWDRKKAVDIWTLAFPGMEQKANRDLRVCLTAMPHEYVCRETQDDVMAILAWSFQALAKGEFPSTRHDHLAWQEDDAWRKQRAGSALLHGALLEVKGDWKQLHHCFAVPGWMSNADSPICWRCKATKRSLVTRGEEDRANSPNQTLEKPLLLKLEALRKAPLPQIEARSQNPRYGR